MYCTKCNYELTQDETICPQCGCFIAQESSSFIKEDSTNSLPAEIKKWNWGAFMLNIFWGVGNYAYLPLLCLIPIFNLIWMFVCGAKGNEWAWKSGKFHDVETFLAIQKTWNKAGFVSFIISVVLLAFYLLIFIPIMFGLLA